MYKESISRRVQWCVPITPDPWEAEAKGPPGEAQPQQLSNLMRPWLKNLKTLETAENF